MSRDPVPHVRRHVPRAPVDEKIMAAAPAAPGGGLDADPVDPARDAAHARAYVLLETAQTEAAEHDELARALDEAIDRGWPEVAFVLHYARAAAADRRGGAWDEAVDVLADLADETGDAALAAIVAATRAEIVGTDRLPCEADDVDETLAESIARLDEGEGHAGDRPTAYIACGLVYLARGLWELSDEMFATAEDCLRSEASAIWEAWEPARAANLRAIAVNRHLARLTWACALVDLGERAEAAAVARCLSEAEHDDLGSLPREWQIDLEAVQWTLAAIGARPAPRPFDEALERVRASTWPSGEAVVLMGEALRAHDAGDLARAASLAGPAVDLLEASLFAPRFLSLRLAAGVPADHPALRYGDHVVRALWHSRLAELTATRARIAGARLTAENAWLSRHAHLDELTGLANRRAHARRLDALRHRPAGETLAVLVIDADRFKGVNDTFGHPVGDAVLTVIAEALRDAVRGDDLAARTGGDEFVVLLEHVDREAARQRGELIVQRLAAHPWHEIAPGLAATVSVGVATGEARAVDALIAEADRSLYAVKAEGRGTVAG